MHASWVEEGRAQLLPTATKQTGVVNPPSLSSSSSYSSSSSSLSCS